MFPTLVHGLAFHPNQLYPVVFGGKGGGRGALTLYLPFFNETVKTLYSGYIKEFLRTVQVYQVERFYTGLYNKFHTSSSVNHHFLNILISC